MYVFILLILPLICTGFMVTVNVDLSLETPASRVFLAGSWNSWGSPAEFELFPIGNGIWSGTKDLNPGTYEYQVTSGDWAGWGPITYAPPLHSECDYSPNNEWNNYGFAVSGPKVVSICASFCAETCDLTVTTTPCPIKTFDDRSDGLVFEEEFNGESLDTCVWRTIDQQWPYNGELEFYTSREKNVRVSNGMLIIEAHEESYSGAAWTSGRIESQEYFDAGRIEIRARLPKGQGLWPALWLLGVRWPTDGEVDMMENMGHELNKFSTTLHWGESSSAREYKWSGELEVCDLSEDFHILTVDRSDSEIVFLFDNQPYAHYLYSELQSQNPNFDIPFGGPLSVILNTAVGGAFLMNMQPYPGVVWERSVMEVDYVRVYSLESISEVDTMGNTVLSSGIAFTSTTPVCAGNEPTNAPTAADAPTNAPTADISMCSGCITKAERALGCDRVMELAESGIPAKMQDKINKAGCASCVDSVIAHCAVETSGGRRLLRDGMKVASNLGFIRKN